MRNQGQLIVGAILVLWGLAALVGSLFNINVWAFCWPVGLIALGIWLVFRPKLSGPGWASEVMLLGELRRRGVWAVRNEEFWLGIGDVDLDMMEAVLPPGETVLRLYSFVTDVEVLVPRSVGVAVSASAFVVDAELLGHPTESFLAPVQVTSENYASADSRLRVEMVAFVANLKVKQL